MTSSCPVKTYEEIAREYDAMKEAGTELDNLVPVKATVAKEPRAVFSVRMTPAELDIIESAAKKRGISISDLSAQGRLRLPAKSWTSRLENEKARLPRYARR